MRAIFLAALATVALALAGCSGGGPETETSTTTTATETATTPAVHANLTVAAVGIYPVNPAFDPTELSVPAGATVHVQFHNGDLNPAAGHNWVVEGIEGAETPVVGAGEDGNVTFTAPMEAGEHAFYCSVPGHRDAGMEGTLTVTAA